MLELGTELPILPLIALWIAWVAAGGSPGPATMSIAGTSMQSGRRAGMFMAFGILFGSACWGLAAAAGLSGLMLANAWAFEILRYAGAAYLLWLAVKAARSAWAGWGQCIHRRPGREVPAVRLSPTATPRSTC